jgi:hypothetical protein
MTAITLPNSLVMVETRAQAGKITWSKTLAMLFSRVLLFAFYQALIALIYLLLGAAHPWLASAAWWPATATLTNLTSIYLLSRMAKSEGLTLWDLYRPGPIVFWRELLITVGVFAVCGVLAYFPNVWLGALLFADQTELLHMFFRPLPMWGFYLGLLFPLTIGLAELPTYFAYVMPRLEALTGRAWLAVLVSGLMLGFQHATLPLLFDWRFIVWRLLMYLPFALFMAIVLHWRPRLLPFMMVGHMLIDFSTMMMLLSVLQGTM